MRAGSVSCGKGVWGCFQGEAGEKYFHEREDARARDGHDCSSRGTLVVIAMVD